MNTLKKISRTATARTFGETDMMDNYITILIYLLQLVVEVN